MAQMPGMNKCVDAVIKDQKGNSILIISMREKMVIEPNGSMTKYRIGENIQLVCGSIYNPTMSIGENPSIFLSVCEFCRKPSSSLFDRRQPSHGLCSRAAGSTCVGCGAFMCPTHAKRCSDGSHRCQRCRQNYMLLSWLSSLFFKSED